MRRHRSLALLVVAALAAPPVLAQPVPARSPPPPAAPIAAVALPPIAAVAPPASAASDAPEPADASAPGAPPLDGDHPTNRSLVLSAAGAVGIYAVLYGWLSLAWFVRTTDADHFAFHDEGWFGPDTYAGGADKLGHLWGNYAMTRGVSRILQYGGWPRTGSVLVAGGLSLGFFTVSEIKDGYKVEYGFSYGDMIANTAGVALGVLLEFVPALDRRFDVRMSYLPSDEYLARLEEAGPFNTPEDYSGQTVLVAYHLGSIPAVRARLGWVQYLDLSIGYRARNYLPLPDDGADRSQELFAGISLDVQAMAAAIAGRGVGGRVLNFVTEMYQPPFTTLELGAATRASAQPMGSAMTP
ncbi:MAG: DUF2279 domain-containing protein [Myxococcales bacterium]|nr:DUF2279 domain-containing protein [Myxococcales bacterium]